ncbi:MAG: hypothetical protein HKM95_11815 [Inquilinus sp.]|nr:hypothetical protein [Inquilinus sp.]
MPDGAIIDRGFEDLAILPRLEQATRHNDERAAFDRLLGLLRITNSQISLFHLRVTGNAGAAETDRLVASFENEALVERLDGTARALLFVRRGEDAGALTARLLDRMRQALRDVDLLGEARIELSAVHRDSGSIGDADELMGELMFQVSAGICIVAV